MQPRPAPMPSPHNAAVSASITLLSRSERMTDQNAAVKTGAWYTGEGRAREADAWHPQTAGGAAGVLLGGPTDR